MSIRSRPMSRPQTLGERLSKLPEELIIQVLESALVLLGPISKKDFWAGKCEWPGCLCENSDWEHVSGEDLTNKTLLPWLLAPRPVPRLAQFVFYTSNAFRVCDPRSEMDWPPGNWVWLPPQHARQWIQRLEIQYLIESLPAYPPVHGSPDFKRDVLTLRQIRRAVDGFTKLRALKLMFEAVFVINDDRLAMLDHAWGTLEHFHFQTPRLILEACSPYPEERDDVQEGDLARDERLEKVLAKHMSAMGMVNRSDETRSWADGECP